MRPTTSTIALSRDPFANLGKRVAHAVRDRAGRQVATRRASNLRKVLRAKKTFAEGVSVPVDRLKTKAHFVEHHLAHIGSSYYVSPFDRAAVLSIDGFGDMVSAMWGIVGEGGRVKVLGEVAFPIRSASTTRPSRSSSASRSTATSTR